MKNFIHAASLRARARRWRSGSTRSASRSWRRTRTWSALTMLGRDLPFPAALVPAATDGFEASDRLFARDRGEQGTARLELARDDDGGFASPTTLRAGRHAAHQGHRLRLRRLRPRRAHDPPRAPGPAALHLGRHRLAVHRCADALGGDPAELRGRRAGRRPCRGRLPRLREPLDPAPRPRDRQPACSSAGRSWPRSASTPRTGCGTEAAQSEDDPTVRTYADPRPPYGHIGLVLRRYYSSRRIRGSVRPSSAADGVRPTSTPPMRS